MGGVAEINSLECAGQAALWSAAAWRRFDSKEQTRKVE
jgi:hypothetical protein